jgi:hypothetical protein
MKTLTLQHHPHPTLPLKGRAFKALFSSPFKGEAARGMVVAKR